MPSFDIVCKIDKQEMDNALNQARKEIVQRYDLKDTQSEINLIEQKEIVLIAPNEFVLKQVLDVLQSKLVKRGISLKAFEYGNPEPTLMSKMKQTLKIQEGIAIEKAKAIVKTIKDTKFKVQCQIQGDQLRVSGKQIDDLQSIIQLLRTNDHGIHMDFVNMKRD
ncbi:MAG: YajQ family cyclic di-GMP-binding protein [Deltaproteobacteria bacterium GWA2_38_16]|nr:MAG: YajQ family cyclic di-GMP-binding protein [Deltaproteobacteria bacterium GWA2_38_16]OGQ03398.1 MAG: YajQ family cyclic di-GMP-binding protein [Deltaproteobacteria bacterium RIFCSPHIGHO2_02_FULL_38_15]OGQ34719.1 MAG: YajQ family cyclic di-GMP-binding protein [Deltaproteobacteria bacterium RIFCSPLOWO2_01_FULL_38_9]OGQ61927.1 MAG: YajQ family cyclic di-GMP-binding protein [Deltaproteobacteria bacterium RIFCSPLOWO2_12_FULL_38_8]HBQ20675.1 YajQ family cyclic di-GMP-binding protein [Deltaprot